MMNISTTSSPTSRPIPRLLAATALILLLPVPRLTAQQALPQAPTPVPAQETIVAKAPLTLHIDILDGEGALNNIRERTAREPIVQVEDENHKPVAGVAVVFTSINGSSGASGTFGAATSFRTVTDAQGKAIGHGFQPNAVSGQFSIQVEASVGTVSAKVVVHQINSINGGEAGGQTSSSVSQASTPGASTTTTVVAAKGLAHIFQIIPKWAIVGVAATGASAVAIGVTHTTPGATISSGGGTVTAPANSKAPAKR